MYHIETKRVRKIWYCFGTIKGYDHSFNGGTIESCQRQMKEMLERKQIKDEKCVWEEVKEYDEPPKQEHLGGITRPPRLDYL
jgi:hypothetical protein